MNLKALTEQRAEKQTEMETLLNTVKTEERAFTEEENELFKKLESEIGLINETISAITKGRELTDKEIRYIVNVIMIWILREVEL